MAREEVLDRLLAQLNASKTCNTDKALNQVIAQLIKELRAVIGVANSNSGGGGGGSSVINNITNVQQVSNPLGNGLLYGGGEGSRYYIPSNSGGVTPGSSDDYVVLSDGALPTPNPVNDGAGNFIYIPYIP